MRLTLLLGVLALGVAACGGPAAATPAPPTAAAPSAATATCSGSGGKAIGIANNAFSPFLDNIAVGGTVTWTNRDPVAHTVTFYQGPDCGQVASGATVSVTFGTAGNFTYHCTIHGSMNGEIVVRD